MPKLLNRSLSGLFSGVLIASLLVACGPQGPTRLKMRFEVAKKANDDRPVQVDVLVAYDPALVEELDRLTSAEWFAQRDQRMRSNPGEQSFSTWRWELTPGLELPNIEFRLRGVPAQGLLFADYLSRGKHSARFDPALAQTVQFRQSSFRMIAGQANEPESRGWRPPVGWTTIGLGVVGVGLGTYFAFQRAEAVGETDGLGPRNQSRHEALMEDIDDYELGMTISYAAGGVLILAGALILLWPESNESPFREVPDSGGNNDVGESIFRW